MAFGLEDCISYFIKHKVYISKTWTPVNFLSNQKKKKKSDHEQGGNA